jgi:hypothetical protein
MLFRHHRNPDLVACSDNFVAIHKEALSRINRQARCPECAMVLNRGWPTLSPGVGEAWGMNQNGRTSEKEWELCSSSSWEPQNSSLTLTP